MGGILTNIYGDSEISGKSPDCSGDYYLVTDRQYDHDFYVGSLVDSMVKSSNNPDDNFQIISSGVVSDGGSGTIDVTQCVAIGYDDNDKKRIIEMPAQTGLSLPSGWNDGRQIWVTLKHDYKLGTLTRVHKASGSYHYQLEDTYYGDPNGISSGTSDDLFIDVDPTGNDVILGSFTMTGTTYVDQDERSVTYQPKMSGVVNKQTDFNSLIERTGANAYQFKDEVKSLIIKNNETGYLCYGTDSFLSDGDSYGVLSLNQCQELKLESGAYLSVGDTAFYLNMNKDNAVLENVWLKGTGSSAIEVTYSFYQDAATTGLLLKNCKVSDRYTDTSIHYAFCGQQDILSRIEGATVDNITSDHELNCFYQFNNCLNCYAMNIDFTGSSQSFYAFNDCDRISNCIVDTIDATTGSIYGFYSCEFLSNCIVQNMIVTGATTNTLQGYRDCSFLDLCSIKTCNMDNYELTGFKDCDQLASCLAQELDTAGVSIYGFRGCDQMSSCKAIDIDNSGTFSAIGISNSNRISSCYTTDIDSSGGTAHGFYACSYISSSFSDEATNSSNDWVDTVDAQVTNKVSCPSIFT